MLARQDGLEPLFHQLLAGPGYRIDASPTFATRPRFQKFCALGVPPEPGVARGQATRRG
jgi:hypothetical protein